MPKRKHDQVGNMETWEAELGLANNAIAHQPSTPSPPPSPKDKLLPVAAVHDVDEFTLSESALDAVGQWKDGVFSFHVQ